MITRAKFQNFKALRDVEVTFDSRLTVLVGPNGSGKTSVLQGIDSICAALRNEATAVLSPQWASQFYSKNASEEMVLELGTDLDHESFQNIRIRTPRPAESTNGASAFIVRTEVAEHSEAEPDGWIPPPPGVPRKNLFTSTFLRLSPKQLAEISIPGVVPIIAEDGSGLPSVLVAMVLGEPTKFASLLTVLRQVVPAVRGIRFQRVPVSRTERETVKIDSEELTRHVQREYSGDRMLFDFDATEGVPASMVSDGTLLTTGLLAWVFGQGGRRILLLDDIDQGLHPRAQMELINVIRKLLDQFPDLQIIATSHSPYILSKLEWNEVRVTGFKGDGSVICARLEDHPEVERWREAMTPGEFWSHIGDDWVKKLDRPQPATAAP